MLSRNIFNSILFNSILYIDDRDSLYLISRKNHKQFRYDK